MSSAPAYMAFYPGDYLADTTHLTLEEHGAYCLLIMLMWRRGGSVPNDDAELARMMQTGISHWRKVKARLMPLLVVDGDHLTQKRVQEEIKKARQKSAGNSRSANARWNKNKDLLNANALRLQCVDSGSGYVSSDSKKDKKDSSGKSQLEAEFANMFWPAWPNKTGKPDALKKFITKRRSYPLETIMAGLERYIAAKPAYRPWLNPATFLNQERFMDEPAKAGPVSFGDIVREHMEEIDGRGGSEGNGNRKLRGNGREQHFEPICEPAWDGGRGQAPCAQMADTAPDRPAEIYCQANGRYDYGPGGEE